MMFAVFNHCIYTTFSLHCYAASFEHDQIIYGMCFDMKVIFNAKNVSPPSPVYQSSRMIVGNWYRTSLEWIPVQGSV